VFFLLRSFLPSFALQTDTFSIFLVQKNLGQVCYRIHAQVPVGEGVNNPMFVQVGSLKSRVDNPQFEFLSYAPPQITNVIGLSQGFPTDGYPAAAGKVVVTGSNFAYDGTIIFGSASNDGTPHQISCGPSSPGYVCNQTTISCYIPAGEGTNLAVRVVVAGQVSSSYIQQSLSYFPPSISSFSVDGNAFGAADTIGGQTLTISGNNFGRPYSSVNASTSAGQPPTVQLGPLKLSCLTFQSSHHSISCTIPQGDGVRQK